MIIAEGYVVDGVQTSIEDREFEGPERFCFIGNLSQSEWATVAIDGWAPICGRD